MQFNTIFLSLVNKRNIRFTSLLFINYLISILITTGVLTGFAFKTSGVKSVMLVAIVQTLAIIGSIFYSKLVLHRFPFLILYSLLMAGILSFFCSLTDSNSVVWYVLMFGRLVLGFGPLAHIVAKAPDYLAISAAESSKTVQLISMLATLLGFGIGPILFDSLGVNKSLVIDSFLMIFSCVVMPKDLFISTLLPNKKTTLLQDKTTGFLFTKIIICVVISNLMLWSVLGVVNIVETPFLILSFAATAKTISFAFFLSAISGFVASIFIPPKLFSTNLIIKMALFAFLTSLTCVGFFYSQSIAAAILWLIALGWFNVWFNACLLSGIQSEIKENARTFGFLSNRLAAHVGILIAACFEWYTGFDGKEKWLYVSFSMAAILMLFFGLAIVSLVKKESNQFEKQSEVL